MSKNFTLTTPSWIEYAPKCAEFCKKWSNTQICERWENCNNFKRLQKTWQWATANAQVSDLLNLDIY